MRRFVAFLLFSCLSCSSEAQSSGITGVYDASQALQAGNTAILRYWFTADGKWGKSNRQVVGGVNADTCGSTADTSYELKADKVYLRDGSRTSEKSWSLTEGDAVLKLDPPDQFLNGTAAGTFKRVPSAQTNRDCNSAFQ